MGKKVSRTPRVNRKIVTVSSLDVPIDDGAYWRAQTPAARLRHVEFLRRLNYGEAATSGRLKRVLEVVRLEDS